MSVITAPHHVPLLLRAAPSYADHLSQWGPLPSGDVLGLAERAGVTGRGGAAFPTAQKIAAVAAGGRAVVVANGAEGEPASAKDRTLLRTAPHLVLDGLQLVARATGAREAVVYAPPPLLQSVIGPALAERTDPVRVRTVASPDHFLSGESTAVVEAVDRRPALPRGPFPRVWERGVGGRPTLVQNVETLAHLAFAAHRGPSAYLAAGTADEPGPRLVTVTGAVDAAGVHEVGGGTPLGEILTVAGGVTEPVSALLVGGFHGGWVPFADALRLRLSRSDLAPYDAAPGAGVVVVQPAAVCGLHTAARVVGYLSGQGARQCGPCRNGLPTMAGLLHQLAVGPATPALASEIQRLATLVDGRGACLHPTGTVRLVRSTLRTFADEVQRHLAGRCSGRRPA